MTHPAGKLIPAEICQLSPWIKTAAFGKQLTSLDHSPGAQARPR